MAVKYPYHDHIKIPFYRVRSGGGSALTSAYLYLKATSGKDVSFFNTLAYQIIYQNVELSNDRGNLERYGYVMYSFDDPVIYTNAWKSNSRSSAVDYDSITFSSNAGNNDFKKYTLGSKSVYLSASSTSGNDGFSIPIKTTYDSSLIKINYNKKNTDGTINYDDDIFEPLARFLLGDSSIDGHIENDTEKGGDIGDSSGSGGQDGTLDNSSDVIDIPALPDLSLCSSGFIDMYKMSNANLKSLSDVLWSDLSEVVENLKKIFLDDPLNGIISLALVPLNLTGTTAEVTIGNYGCGFNAQKLSTEWYQLDCGSITIKPYWGNALDYSPHCKCQVYLPFVGTHEINVDDVMNKTVQIIYQINIFNGACTAFIKCGGSVKYSYSGNIISQVPVSGKNSAEIYKSVIGAVGGAVLGVATGGSGLALTGKAIASGVSAMSNKGQIQRGGNTTGANGMLSIKYPYLIFTRAHQSRPENFSKFKGYTSNITEQIKNVSGYSEVSYVHVEIVGALEDDLEEIENILKTGFIA